MPAGRPIALAAAALTLLTACAQGPLTQGTVEDKRGHAAYRTPTYADTYRKTNCRTITTNALTLSSLTGRSGGGFSKPRPSAPKKAAPSIGPKKPKKSRTTKNVCDRVRVSHRRTGWDWTPAHWELKLKDGARTEWVSVNKSTWDRARIHHKIKI